VRRSWAFKLFDNAEKWFVSAYRHHPNNDDYFDILVQYQAIADLNEKFINRRSHACHRTIYCGSIQ
jgi:hypothetical protein